MISVLSSTSMREGGLPSLASLLFLCLLILLPQQLSLVCFKKVRRLFLHKSANAYEEKQQHEEVDCRGTQPG